MQITKNMTFNTYACIVCLQVLICYFNTRLQRLINKVCEKNPSLSVVSDPRNVLRHKQGRLRKKLGFLFRSMYNDGFLSILLCVATFYVQLKPHFLN